MQHDVSVRDVGIGDTSTGPFAVRNLPSCGEMSAIVACRVGSCRQPLRLLDRTAGVRGLSTQVELPAWAFVVDHPTLGPVVFDTGWSPAITQRVPWLPSRVYRSVVRYRLSDDDTIDAHLRRMGIEARDVRHVIVSHLHADHVAGLDAFPRATVHLSAEAWRHVRSVPRSVAWRHGFFPELLPGDLAGRLAPIERFDGPDVGALGRAADPFGDGSILLVDLPGHAPGQIGALVMDGAARTLLAADAAFTSEQIEGTRRPSRAVERLVTFDAAAYRSTLDRLRKAHADDPTLRIVPSHCPAAGLDVGAEGGTK